jgi:hypothetical protein
MYAARAHRSNRTVAGWDAPATNVVVRAGADDRPPRARKRPSDDAVTLLVTDIRDRMCADPDLGPSLALALPTEYGRPPIGLDAFTRELTEFVGHALAQRGMHGAHGMVRYLRQCFIDRETFDRFGHYVLAGALAHRVGPDGLLLLGAVLADIRHTALQASRDRSVDTPSARSASRMGKD